MSPLGSIYSFITCYSLVPCRSVKPVQILLELYMPLKNIFSLVLFFGVIIVNSLAGYGTLSAAEQPMPKSPSGAAAPALSGGTMNASGADSPYTIYRLSNGLTVALLEDNRFPLVSIRLFVHAGSAYETDDQAGISHLLEHMVFKGTDSFPKGAISSSIESAGGYLNAATSFDYTVYQNDMPAAQWKVGLKSVQEMAFKATIDPNELEPEKGVVIAELQRGEDSPGNRLFKQVQKQALAGTPYERPIIGYENTINATTSEDMHAYIKRLYQPQSMMLLVTGQINKPEVMQEIETLFGSLKNTGPVTPPAKLAPAPGFGVHVEEGPWNKVYLTFAFPAPALTDSRSPELDVLTQLLGGDRTSYLYRKYKYDKRLVDSISASYYGLERLGLLAVSATLDADKLDGFWQEFIKDLPNLGKQTYTEQEFARAKLNLEDDLFRSKETLSGLASKLGYFQFFAGGEEGEKNYLRQINSFDAKRLAALGAEVFQPENLQVSMIIPDAEAAKKDEAGKKAKSAMLPPEKLAEKLSASLRKAWPAKATSATQEQAKSASTPEIIKLDDNRTLVLVPDATMPYTSVDMMFHGGDALLKPDQQGLAAFTASLLTRGTQKRNATDIEDYNSDRAAGLGASAGRQSFSLSLSQPSRFNADMFKLLQETLTQPAFKDEELARVRENQISAIKVKEDQPLGLAFRRLFPFLYGDHPYGFLQLGTVDGVSKFSRPEVLDFWKKQVQEPWVIAVSGDFDQDEIIKAVKALPEPKLTKPVLAKADFKPEKNLDLNMPGRTQAHLLLLFKTDGYGSEDTPGLDLLNAVLAGQSGLLFRDMRDVQGLGYTVTSMTWQAQEGGFMAFYIGTEPGKMDVAEEGFRKIIKELQEKPLDNEELARGKNQLEGDYYRGHQSLGARSGEASSMTLMGYELEHPRKNIERAAGLTPQDLQRLAQKYLKLDEARIVKVLP